MTAPSMGHRLTAEFVGTFLLVFGGCGAAVLAANPAGDRTVGIGYVGVALAFGLSLLAGVYAFGSISGAHFNPAVTLGAALAKRIEGEALLKYWIVQVLGGLLAGGAIYLIASGRPKFNANSNMSASGYGANSPFHYSLTSVLIAETVLSFLFVLVVLASTGDRAPKWFGGLSIGLTYTLVHLIALPVSNTLINPAASTGVAFFNGAGAPGQLWAFWIAPLVGATVAGWTYPALFDSKSEPAELTAR
ncbi:aquaporin Z [Mycolicibacterium sp.]|uniref:aquaporin Z n=1 Tax=Mycolicibacterium sp. TaxID=2320850 RepID=UPI0025EFD41A|nr:aquaporin Z [Mycolicibacterium sp.]